MRVFRGRDTKAGDVMADLADLDPFDTLVECARRRLPVGALVAVAAFGLVLGTRTLVMHLEMGPLADVRAYYEAAARLNAGLPLYPAGADVDAAEFYRYPPLLAILFRPLALLPFPLAALAWQAVVLGATGATIWLLGIRRPAVWLGVAYLASPFTWTLAIGQAQALVTFFTVLGSPLAIAVATNLKLFPALVAVWWLGRRDWRSLRRFAGWMAALALVQFALEPANSIEFLRITNLEQVGQVRNLSPYAISPLLWAVLVAAGTLAALRLAPTRWGWAAAVALSVLATPRLLLYMGSTLLAALARPCRR